MELEDASWRNGGYSYSSTFDFGCLTPVYTRYPLVCIFRFRGRADRVSIRTAVGLGVAQIIYLPQEYVVDELQEFGVGGAKPGTTDSYYFTGIIGGGE